MTTNNILFKVWDCTRRTKKVVMAKSMEDLLQKAKVKLNLDAECMDLRVVMEKDGTEIDEDEALVLLKEQAFMILVPGQTWTDKDATVTVSSVSDEEAPSQINRNEVSSSTLGKNPAVTTTSSTITSSSQYKIGIPNFSDYVKAKLYSNESHLVWTKMIQEAAYYYMAHYPEIGINSSTDYRNVGQQMVQEFPSIRREGANPWSFFTSALSQKIRRVRWDNKRKSSPSPSHPKKVTKRFHLHTDEANAEDEDDNCYEEHVKELTAEMDKKNVDNTHIKTLLKSTFKQRRVWVGTVPNGEVAPILMKFPCLKETRFIMYEFKMILRVGNLQKYMERLQLFFQAASTLMKNGSSADNVEILLFIEVETGYRHGKGPKTKPIVEEKKLTESVKMDTLLKSEPKSAPKLVNLVRDGQTVNIAITADSTYVLLDLDEIQQGVFALMGFYYLTDLDYPRCYSQLLGLLQHVVLQHPFEGNKTNLFVQFLNKIQNAMSTME